MIGSLNSNYNLRSYNYAKTGISPVSFRATENTSPSDTFETNNPKKKKKRSLLARIGIGVAIGTTALFGTMTLISRGQTKFLTKLYKEKIPYKYEQPYELKKYGIVYPDFRILDVPRRQEIILEHFGMMDDEIYAGKALKKIRLYQKNGLVLGKELLITFETTDAPFDSRTFENMLVAYGLM